MALFFKLDKKDRERLFVNIKRNLNKSWDKIYPSFGVGRTMFFYYVSGKYPLPEKMFYKIQKLSGIKIESYKKIYREKYLKKIIQKPKIDSNLAEIFGVLNGDGHISKNKYEISIVGSIYEENYYFYLKKLFEQKFGLLFRLSRERTKIKLRGYSKNLCDLLIDVYGLPYGVKIGKLKIPKIVLKSRKYVYSYIRGLFDTDGTFYLRRKKDPVIEISSADPVFLAEIQNLLGLLGFNVTKGEKKATLYRKQDIINFFKLIKPANSKHLKKYQNYLKLYLRG